MIVRRLLSRSTITALALALAAGTFLPAAASADSTSASAGGGAPTVGVPTQLGSKAMTGKCLTFVVADEVPMAVMLGCNPAPTNRAQNWTYTAAGQLMVSQSRSVGGPIAATGACLDTAADLVAVPDNATTLVLPCRAGAGQKWTYDKTAGTFVNAANGQALSSMTGMAKQAQPVGADPVDGSAAQAWTALPVPEVDLLGAVAALLHAILDALGLDLPVPLEAVVQGLLDSITDVLPLPGQLQTLPEQILDSVR